MKTVPVVAIMYDFDKTLCTDYMQNYSFIPSLGIENSEFWNSANHFGKEENMDSILAYMYTMIRLSKEKQVPLLRETLVNTGKFIELYQGLDTWFDRIDRFGASQGVQVEHYVISSGLKEIIEGTSISNKFKRIFACEFYYDEQGNGIWPKTCVNYTNKTQFVYRINKGVLDVSNDDDLNKSMPDDSKRVPFCNMIYIGDGLSDVPCMKMMKAYGGKAIAVYEESNRKKVEELLVKDRVDYIYPTDYSEHTKLEMTVKNIICQMAISDKLYDENAKQLKNLQSQ